MVGCTCSNEPIISVTLVARLMTGLTILAGLENRNRPGYWPCFSMGIRPISNVSGTCTQQNLICTQLHGTIFCTINSLYLFLSQCFECPELCCQLPSFVSLYLPNKPSVQHHRQVGGVRWAWSTKGIHPEGGEEPWEMSGIGRGRCNSAGGSEVVE